MNLTPADAKKIIIAMVCGLLPNLRSKILEKPDFVPDDQELLILITQQH